MDFNRVYCNTGVQKIITKGTSVMGRRRLPVTEAHKQVERKTKQERRTGGTGRTVMSCDCRFGSSPV